MVEDEIQHDAALREEHSYHSIETSDVCSPESEKIEVLVVKPLRL